MGITVEKTKNISSQRENKSVQSSHYTLDEFINGFLSYLVDKKVFTTTDKGLELVEDYIVQLVDKDILTIPDGAGLLHKTELEFVDILKKHNVEIEDEEELISFLKERERNKGVDFYK